MAITLEVSETKSRPASDLRALWGENRDALLALAAAAALGGGRGGAGRGGVGGGGWGGRGSGARGCGLA
jgi:hypothetical protein